MKKLLFLTLSAFIVLNACKKSDDSNIKSNEEEEMSMSVASVKSILLKSDGITDDLSDPKHLYTYEKGKLIEVRDRSSYYWFVTYEYFADKIISTETWEVWDGIKSGSNNFKLDEKGRISERDILGSKYRYTYGNNGYIESAESNYKKTNGGWEKNINYFTFISGNLSTVKGTGSNGTQHSATYTYSEEDIQLPRNLGSFLIENLGTSAGDPIFDDVSEPFLGKTLFTKVPQSLQQTIITRDGSKYFLTRRFYYDKKDQKGRVTEFRIVDEDPTSLGTRYSGKRYAVTYND